MEKHYFLFDIDGVLLHPGGYRKAAHDTIYYFLKEFGFINPKIDHDTFPIFESMETTSEWDMIPLYILASLELFFDKHDLNYSLDSLDVVSKFIKDNAGNSIPPSKKITDFLSFFEDGKSKAECVLDQKDTEKFHKYFPKIKNWVFWLVDDLLNQSNNPYISRTTAFFQNLILGDQLFLNLLSLAPFVQTDSYLVLYDEKILNDQFSEKIAQAIYQKQIFCAAITARPTGLSLPKIKDQVYFPEGELGLKTVQLDHISVIGFGALDYLANVIGKTGEYYLKPSPIHALATILASTGYSDVEAVMCSYQLMMEPFTENNRTLLDNLFSGDVRIHIFEDSTGGIRSVKRLIAWLNQMGYQVIPELYGISQDPIKIRSLKKENAAIYTDINAALQKGLGNFIC